MDIAITMYSSRPPSRRNSYLQHADAFTLIELLAVMAIILVLAGLILGVAAHANSKASMQRATTEVKALGSAIENYKIDNGTYPRSTETDTLNPQRDFDPGTTTNSNPYKAASKFLYQELSGLHRDTDGKITTTKQYFSFQPSQLDIAPGAPSSTTVRTPTSPDMYVADPFGFSYGYSTGYLKATEDAANGPTPGATPAPGAWYNPTYDLWSSAGYSVTGGRPTPANGPANATQQVIYSGLWIKNW